MVRVPVLSICQQAQLDDDMDHMGAVWLLQCCLPLSPPLHPARRRCAPAARRPRQALLGMRAAFADIAGLCAECASLIDCHDRIAALAGVHRNLRKTLQARRCVAWMAERAAAGRLGCADQGAAGCTHP